MREFPFHMAQHQPQDNSLKLIPKSQQISLFGRRFIESINSRSPKGADDARKLAECPPSSALKFRTTVTTISFHCSRRQQVLVTQAFVQGSQVHLIS